MELQLRSLALSPYLRWRAVLVAVVVASLLSVLLSVAAPSVFAPPAGAQETVTCYAISDGGGEGEGGADGLLRIDDALGAPAVTVVDPGMETLDAEAFAIRPGADPAGYAWATAQNLVTVDLTNGDTADAGFDIPGKVEGLTWANVDDNDLTNDVLFAIQNNGDVIGYDDTGAVVAAAVNVTGAGFTEGGDIAWDPTTDTLYAIRTNPADNTQIVTVVAGGALVGDSKFDLEGLGFVIDGTMIGTTGDDGDDSLNIISKADGSPTLLLAGLAPIDNEDVDCLPEDFPLAPGVISAVITDSCVDADGKITATVTYDSGDSDVDFALEIDGVEAATGTVNAGNSPQMIMTASDLADATVTAELINTTDGGTVVATQSITINCDVPPAAADLDASVSTACVDEDGQLTATITYVSGELPADYQITVTGAAPVTGTLNPGDAPAVITIGGLPDGDLAFVIDDTTNSIELESGTIPFSCDAPPEPPTAVATFTCVDDAADVKVTLSNPGNAPVVFLVDVLGVQGTDTLGPIPNFLAGDVLINEFMADNETTFVDGNGEFVDWIELFNTTGAQIDLSGWSITDDAGDTTKQVLPAGSTIPAGGYLYLFQGDGNLGAAGPTFDFGLSSGGEYLGLYDDNGAVVSEYAAEYPDQMTDVSFGIGSDGDVGYFLTPSLPQNGSSVNGVADIKVATTMETVTGVPDGLIDVVVTADGVQIPVTNSPLDIDCQPDGEITLTYGDTCVAENGVITITVTNTTPNPAAIVASFSAGGGPDITETVAAGNTATLTRSGRADGTYDVTVTVDGVAQPVETITIACDPLEAPAITIEKSVNGDEADAAPGPLVVAGSTVTYDYKVTNTGDVALTNVTVTDSDAGVTIVCPSSGTNVIASMAVGAMETCTATITAVAGLVTTSGAVVGTSPANATVNAADPANYTGEVDEGELTFEFAPLCITENGAFLYTITNGTLSAATAVLSVTGLPDKTVTVAAGATTVVSRTGRPDGTYTVELAIDGAVVDSRTEIVECDIVIDPTSEIGDFVYNDTNMDGIQDAGELGIAGITVNLWTDDNGDGAPDTQINTTTTGPNGEYLFTGLDAGLTYVVQFVPAGRTISPQNTGSTPNPATGITGPINLVPGQFDDTIDAGMFDDGQITFTEQNLCIGGNGAFYFFVTNGTLNPSTAVLSVTGLPDKTVVVAPGATSLVARTGRPDGVYNVDLTIDGQLVSSSPQPVECDAAPGIALAKSAADPVENVDGTFTVTYTLLATNVGDQQLTVTSIDDDLAAAFGAALIGSTITTDLCTNSQLAINATCTQVIEVIVDPAGNPGPYLNVATVNAVTASGTVVSDESNNGTDPDPEGDGPGDNSDPTPVVFPGAVAFEFENVCISMNGAFFYTVTNNTLGPVDATLSVTGLPDRTVTIGAQSAGVVARTGRPDNTYTVELAIDGATVDTRTEVVACDVPADIMVMTSTVCVGDDGRIAIDVINKGGVSADYVVDISNIPGHLPFVGSVDGGDTASLLRTGRPDGLYTITVTIDGMEFQVADVRVLCDGVEGQGAAIISPVECVGASQGIPVTLQHVTGDTPVEFIATATDGANTFTLGPVSLDPGDADQLLPFAGLPTGTYDVTVTGNGGVLVQAAGITVDASAVGCANATVTTQCNSGFPVYFLNNPTSGVAIFTVTGTDTADATKTETKTVTVGPGLTNVRVNLLTLAAIPGTTFDLTADINGINFLTTTATVSCPDVEGEGDAIVGAVQCVGTSNTIPVTLRHLTGVTNVDFTGTATDGVTTVPMTAATLAPSDNDLTVNFGALAPGTWTVTVEGNGAVLTTQMVTVPAATTDCVEVRSTTQCLSGFPVFFVDNPSASTAVVTLTGTDVADATRTETKTVTVGAGLTNVRVNLLTLGSPSGTVFDVTASVGGIDILMATETVSCPTARAAAQCGMGYPTYFLSNPSTVDLTYTLISTTPTQTDTTTIVVPAGSVDLRVDVTALASPPGSTLEMVARIGNFEILNTTDVVCSP